MSTKMRDGTTVEDHRLGRLEQFDERSRQYPVTALLSGAEERKGPRSYSWRVMPGTVSGPTARGGGRWLDQGGEGSCVGHGVAHEAAARPKVVKGLTGATALGLYKRAQFLDPWEGEAYSGTSVLAGVQAAVEAQWYSEYRWAFGEEDLWQVVGRVGPAILGIPWYESMYAPNKNGYLVPEGRLVGGHCLLLTGQSVKRGEYELLNSWDTFGPCRITREHLARLLREDGEAVVPVTRLIPA